MMRYPEYKEGGVEFIGDIPKHWDTMRCAHLFELKHIKKTSGEINLSVYRDYGVIKRDSRNDNYNRVSEDTSNYKLVESGDFVFNKMKCWQGSLGVSEYRGIVSPAYTVCKPKRHFHGKYFHYLLRSQPYIQEFNRLSYGVRIGQWELRFEDFKDIVVPYPSLSEQVQIASFLDRKTEQIDELIRIKERQIALLQEQRTALINQAVTKGLDPNVEMKPSGVEWIGEIPKHWKISKVKHKFESLDNLRIPLNSETRGSMKLKIYDYYGASGIIDKVENYIFDEPLILIGEDGANLYLRSTPLAFKATGKYWVNNHAHVLKPKHGNIDYFTNMLESLDYTHYITGAAQPKLTSVHLMNIIVIIPPPFEQTQIADFLNSKTQQIDELIAAEQRKIELLKEYRQSLISEAVTGKIDVRNEV